MATTTVTEHNLQYDVNKVLHYLQAGPSAGPLVVLMHGWPGIGALWHNQISFLASQGYNVVAPDMPGSGASTSRHVTSDYSQETISKAMITLITSLGHTSAIWIAHDWGCGTLWTLARTHPEVCRAVCGMTIPYYSLELGVQECIKRVNRKIYPVEKYPYGQWSYQIFYQKEFDKATEWFEKDIAGFIRMAFSKTDPSAMGQPAFTATVMEDGGWLGGAPSPPPVGAIPDEAMLIDNGLLAKVTSAFQTTGFWGADAWYNNHDANRQYNAKFILDKKLQMPVLFIEAAYDVFCDTAISQLADTQGKLCTDLTYKSIEAGHTVYLEQSDIVNKVILDWLHAKKLL